jgi:Integrase core domain
MSRPANPYDNASCASFMKTLKREEIYATNYNDLEHLRANIEEFIEQYYNRLRLHSALGYRPPEEFEQQIEASGSGESRSATMVFFEKKENSGKISKDFWGKGLKCRRAGNSFPRTSPVFRDSVCRKQTRIPDPAGFFSGTCCLRIHP